MVKVLPLFYKLTNIKAIKSVKLKDGITNINYKVITKDQDYVIRIPRKNIIGINRLNEKKIIETIKPLKINVDIIYFDENSGIMISKYVKRKRTKLNEDDVINHLKKLHSLNTNDIMEFKPFDLLETYKKIANNETFINQENVIKKAKSLYKKYPLVLCHNDLLYANFINSTYLIDYEYAGKNIALFDVVSFLSENNILDIKKQVSFITKYFKEIDQYLLKDIDIMFLFLDLLWGYWAYAMYYLYKEEVFLNIAKEKQNRFNARSYIC